MKLLDDGKYIYYRSGKIYNKKLNKYNTGTISDKGYVKVGVHGKKVFLHRAIAIIFIPNPLNKPQINHIDGNKQNNNVDNLEWVTNLENYKHALRTGLRDNVVTDKVRVTARQSMTQLNKIHNPLKRKMYNEVDIYYIRKAHQMGHTYLYLSNLFGVGIKVIRKIVKHYAPYDYERLKT